MSQRVWNLVSNGINYQPQLAGFLVAIKSSIPIIPDFVLQKSTLTITTAYRDYPQNMRGKVRVYSEISRLRARNILVLVGCGQICPEICKSWSNNLSSCIQNHKIQFLYHLFPKLVQNFSHNLPMSEQYLYPSFFLNEPWGPEFVNMLLPR